MDFESPDVEKDFPGLYSSEAAKKNNESDFSDDSHEKSFKADLIGKKKDKKDSKKDRGYAALEGESSQDEAESKSPSKSKKNKAFKFPVKKSEKREKSRDKEGKEKDKDVEKEKKREREKKEKEKEKSKHKEKKKLKQSEDTIDLDDQGVFGVPLAKAVERLGCLDGVDLPLPVRHCIDCIQANGLASEGLYKNTPVKTKLHTLKKNYNSRNSIPTSDLDVPLAVSLLLTFLGELPEHILTNDLLTRFEEAGAVQDVAQREEELTKLLNQLPACNRTLLSWLIMHFDKVTQHEKQNKINAQSIAMTFSPILKMSHRLLTALLCHCKALFADTHLTKYRPPLPPGSNFPEEPQELSVELQKQEALLTQIHRLMNDGFVSKTREEQLWEVQRIVTQLKRKLRSLKKLQEGNMQKSMDEETLAAEMKPPVPVDDKPPIEEHVTVADIPEEKNITEEFAKVQIAATKVDEKKIEAPRSKESTDVPAIPVVTATQRPKMPTPPCEAPVPKSAPLPSFPLPEHNPIPVPMVPDLPTSGVELRLHLENIELHKLHGQLRDRIDEERKLIRSLQNMKSQIESYGTFINSDSENSSCGSSPAYLSAGSPDSRLQTLLQDNSKLLAKRDDLMRQILEEREACMKLNVSINYIELMNKSS